MPFSVLFFNSGERGIWGGGSPDLALNMYNFRFLKAQEVFDTF